MGRWIKIATMSLDQSKIRHCILQMSCLVAAISLGVCSCYKASEAVKPAHVCEVNPNWPFTAAQAKARQRRAGKLLNLSIQKNVDLGNGVQMEFILIPHGRFVLGTPKPKMPVFWIAQVIVGIFGILLVILLVSLLVAAKTTNRRIHYSLRYCVSMVFVMSGLVYGVLEWRSARNVLPIYKSDLARYLAAPDSEKAAIEITLEDPYFIGKIEVTMHQYFEVMGRRFPGVLDFPTPVAGLKYKAIERFCVKLTNLLKERDPAWPGNWRVRLPTEAEWEYACRAGSVMSYHNGDTSRDLESCGWFEENRGVGPGQGGKKVPNAFGIYDMHGNVSEYCLNRYKPYSKWRQADAVGNIGPGGKGRVLRGGSVRDSARECRSASRKLIHPWKRGQAVGFRVIIDMRPD